MSKQRLILSSVVLFAIAAVAAPVSWAVVGAPQPGEVYREYTFIMSNASQTWRVTDPNTTNPNARAELPNATHSINIPAGELAGATRATLLFDYWGGHPGTVGQKFKFNNNALINIPALTTTPQPATGNNRPECYMQQFNPVSNVPLSHLKAGTNVLARTSGGQTCYSFNWGQWGSYAATLRVYYNPGSVPAPTGSITSPATGGTIGENPTIQVSASGGGGITRVDVLAWVEAYDWDGDGVYTDWGQAYHRAKTANNLNISHHVGTKTSAPWNFVFNTELIPDQPAGAVKFQARIKGANGLWYVTPVKQNITLTRSGSVKLFKPKNVPSRFWTRVTRRNMTSRVNVPQSVNLNDLRSAKLLVRTWNGVDGAGPGTHSTSVNNWKIPGTYGQNHHYSADALTVQTSRIIHGDNIIKFDSASTHHGIEILWPGPALLLRFGSTVGSFCGDGTVNPGEQCDDGNNSDGDGCNANCTLPTGGVCGNGVVDPGEQCDDGNGNNNDACLNNCTLPAQPSDLPALYPFEGTGSQIADASGNGNTGTLVGAAARTSNGRFGKAIQFNGNSGHVNLGTLDVGGNQGTWAAYFRPDDFGISDARILSKATSVMDDDHYWMLSTIQQSGVRHLRFRLKVNGTTRTLIGTGTLAAGQWVHAAATYNGSTIRLYQNGTLVGSLSASGPITGNGGVEAWIGDHVGGGKSFDGTIDEVLIDDRAYTVAEIGELVTASLVGGPSCGDGNVDSGEECDDGNNASGDGCQADCMLPDCGDGSLDPGEVCDDGNATNGDGCESDCTVTPFCGDNVLDPGEECDDGNNTAGDGCEPDCTTTSTCGDGVVDAGEGCDDGNNVNGDGCQANCQRPACGDGILDAGEACDDGNNADGDGCQADCSLPFCGDGIVDPGEQCDDGNNVGGDGCDETCRFEAGSGPPASVTFFFNGEACTAPTCGGTSDGYTLDPQREHSAGDDTADFNSRGQVSRDASIFGQYGFETMSNHDQMIYEIADQDLLPDARGAVCMIVRNAGIPAVAGHRLFIAHSPDATSYLSVDFHGTDNLRLLHRDAGRVATGINTGAWNGAGGQDAMLIQVSYDSTATTGSLRLIVDGVQRANRSGAIQSMSGLSHMRFGNYSARAGGFDYDGILLSSDPDIDCFGLMSGVCSTGGAGCLEDADCPDSGTCQGVIQDYDDLGGGGGGTDPGGDDPSPGDPELTFFFNGEGCGSSTCSGSDGYSLDPVREFSAGDSTASFVSLGHVDAAGAIFGQRGFSTQSNYDQMTFDVVGEDLVKSAAGSVCMVVQNQGTPALGGHRLMLAHSPSARSYVALEFQDRDDLRVRYRDVDGTNTALGTGAWNGADTTDAMLLQLIYDSTAASGGLRLLVDGVQRAASSGPVLPLGDIEILRFGNSSAAAGAFRYDPLLISERADVDCWDLIAGACAANPQTRCVDDAACPGADTCSGVAQNVNQLTAP